MDIKKTELIGAVGEFDKYLSTLGQCQSLLS